MEQPEMHRQPNELDNARCFRSAALRHLDSLYTYARHLLPSVADADDAVEQCYLRAFRDHGGGRVEEIKPWLLTILRDLCRTRVARRSVAVAPYDDSDLNEDGSLPQYGAELSAKTETLQQLDGGPIRGLLAALPEPLREAIVLRDVNELSYGEIAQIIGAPIGTVMSRIARARTALRAAWIKAEQAQRQRMELGGAV